MIRKLKATGNNNQNAYFLLYETTITSATITTVN